MYDIVGTVLELGKHNAFYLWPNHRYVVYYYEVVFVDFQFSVTKSV